MKFKAIIISLLLPLNFSSNTHNNSNLLKATYEIPKDIHTLNTHTLYIALLDSGILYPDVVFAQAMLETGYLKSSLSRNHNNLFGLYNSRRGEFFKFNHWRESISAYKKYIEVKYTPPIDYLVFLDKMGYAEDPNYISKVQTIMNKHKDDNNKRRSNYESG